MTLERIVFNTQGAVARDAVLEGREHLVVPAVILVEGVHEGSNGPGFYHGEELGKYPGVWNHKPVVVYHPQKDGNFVTACTQDILDTRKTGILLNTKYANGKLGTELWIDKARQQAVDARVLEAFAKGEKVEVSTGLSMDVVEESGVFNGKPYTWVGRNFRPDHLAILPDVQGACSIADGCGALVANAKDPQIARVLNDVLANAKVKFANGELSFDDISTALRMALAAKYGEPGKYWDGYVREVYPTRVIFRPDDDTYRLMLQSYSIKDGMPVLDGEAVEVRQVTEYQTVNGATAFRPDESQPVVNCPGRCTCSRPGEKETANVTKTFDRAAYTANLLSNGYAGKEDFLKSLSDENLQHVQPVTVTPAPAPTTNAAPAVPAVGTPTPAVPTLETLLANSSLDIREMFTEGVRKGNEEKQALIARIKEVPTNSFTDEQLSAMTIANLRACASLVPVKAVTTNGGLPSYFGANVVNATPPADVPMLAIPVLNPTA